MRRDCSVSRLPRVIIFSATGRAAFARVSVVVIRPCSNRLVTRLRSTARRCAGCFPSFEPELRCRIAYIVPCRLTVRPYLQMQVRRFGLGAAAQESRPARQNSLPPRSPSSPPYPLSHLTTFLPTFL